MDVQTPARVPADLDPPHSFHLRAAFVVLWFVDTVAASLFFVLPEPNELNPVTVVFHDLLGLPGVALAASIYATIVLVVGHLLSDPADDRFLSVVVAMYAAFATNNVALLAFGEAPLGDLLATVL